MAALDLATRDDLAALHEELRQLRAAVERLAMPAGGELVTLPEAARRLGKSLRTVNRWAHEGRLSVEMVGGARFVRLPVAARQG